jgi:AhpC/TSA family
MGVVLLGCLGIFRWAVLFTLGFAAKGGRFMKGYGFISALLLAFSLAGLPGAASALEVGDKAPDFDLPSTKGGNFKLSDLAGKKNLVIQFYILDFTPT